MEHILTSIFGNISVFTYFASIIGGVLGFVSFFAIYAISVESNEMCTFKRLISGWVKYFLYPYVVIIVVSILNPGPEAISKHYQSKTSIEVCK